MSELRPALNHGDALIFITNLQDELAKEKALSDELAEKLNWFHPHGKDGNYSKCGVCKGLSKWKKARGK